MIRARMVGRLDLNKLDWHTGTLVPNTKVLPSEAMAIYRLIFFRKLSHDDVGLRF